ncbi:MAG TPA: hypothetical protein VLB44_19280 [Kofleriaceae bacterium]|nr:hypothetical protein [Kofleriaceae bacterium]
MCGGYITASADLGADISLELPSPNPDAFAGRPLDLQLGSLVDAAGHTLLHL